MNGWNPWHGCTKISAGCQHCYVYRRDTQTKSEISSSLCRKNADFDLPVKRKRDGNYKLPPADVYTCFTSDFLLSDADEWRGECWAMMKERSDCRFIFFTKRIDRLASVLPDDWGDGYENVIIGCTVENQDRADYRLPIFLSLPIRHRWLIAEPLLEGIDVSPYLDGIEQISVGGESGDEARPCDYAWVLDLRRQAKDAGIPFGFHQTGANFVKDGRHYRIPRRLQHEQARRAGIDIE